MPPDKDLLHGNTYPFDAPDSWWESPEETAPEPKNWAHYAARGIISNLQGRGGIKHQLERSGITEETRKEIIAEIAAIIQYAANSEINVD